MKTDDLIAALAREAEAPQRPRWAVAVSAGLLAGVLLMAVVIWPRPDLLTALAPTLGKALFSGAFAAAGLALAMRLSHPGAPAQRRAYILAALGASALVAALIAFWGAPREMRMLLLLDEAFPWCLVFVPIFSVPTAIGLGLVMRTRAPTNLTLAGAAIGAAAGGIGAMAYALHCPVDTVLFVSVWYALAIAICAVIGAILGARLLRW